MTGVSHFLIPLVAAIGNLILGVFVLLRGPRLELNRAFAFTTVTVVFWNLNIFSFYAFDDVHVAFFWSRFFRVGTLLMPAAVLHFFIVFCEYRSRTLRTILYCAYAVSVCLVVANAFDLLVNDLRRHEFGFYYVRTSFYGLFSVVSVVCATITLALLTIQCFWSRSHRKRFQARLWLLGTSIAIPFGLTNLFFEPWGSMPPLGNLANMIYVGLIAYGIARHRLLDFDVVITKSMAYVAVSLVIVAPSWLLFLWLQKLSFGQIHVDFSIALLLMIVTVGTLFPGLRLRAEDRIERSLFPAKHEYRASLTAFAQSIIRILDEDALLEELTTTLGQTLKLERIGIVLMAHGGRGYAVRSVSGQRPNVVEFDREGALIEAMQSVPGPIVLDELEAEGVGGRRLEVIQLFRANRWQVCLPLRAGTHLSGFIYLGHKTGHDEYSAGDLELLETIGAEASIALENARLYRELKRSQEIIRRADRLSALGTLAAGIAHEIRNPLVSIQTFFQLAPERLHDEEFMTSFLKLTEEEVARICSLITELLNFAKSPLRARGDVAIDDEIDRVVTLLAPEARKRNVNLGRSGDLSGVHVYADADQIRQVLINIVLNGIQAIVGGGSVLLKSRHVMIQDVGYCQIEIEDSGPGIAEGLREEIFNPFFTTKSKGTGLGLSIAHQIMAEHGGFISVESSDGRGARFFIHFPLGDEVRLGASDPGVGLAALR